MWINHLKFWDAIKVRCIAGYYGQIINQCRCCNNCIRKFNALCFAYCYTCIYNSFVNFYYISQSNKVFAVLFYTFVTEEFDIGNK